MGFDQLKDSLILKTNKQTETESMMEERVMWFEVFLGRNLRGSAWCSHCPEFSLSISHQSQPQQLECAAQLVF